MNWNPSQYLKFETPRQRPALELLTRVANDAPERICDLGCGTGAMARLMADRWPQAHVVGVDASAEMLARAAAAAAARGHKVSGKNLPPIAPVDVIEM